MSQIIINGQPLYQVDLPEMALAEWLALPVAERPKEWIRTDAEYTDIPAENVSFGDGSVADALTWKTLGQLANGDSITIDLDDYRELMIIPLVAGSIPYAPSLMSAAVLKQLGRVYYAVYQDNTYHSNFSLYLSAGTMVLSVASVAGWSSMEVKILAR